MFPGAREIEKLLSDGEFADGTRLAEAMKSVRRILVSAARETLLEGATVDIRLQDGRHVKYTCDASLNAWQQTI